MKNLLAITLLLTILGLNGCKDKTDEINYNPNVLSAKDYVRAEDALFDVINAFFKGVNDTAVLNSGFGYIDDCSVYYYPDEDSITFGYGSVDRYCHDQKYRRGMFIAKFDGDVFEEGVTARIITDSLIVNDIPYEAYLNITNQGINPGNLPEFRVELISSLYFLPDSAIINGITLQGTLSMVWAEGHATPEIHEDDTYLVSGSLTGISSDLYQFTVNVQTPLVDYLDCCWFKSGISGITVPGSEYPDGTMDYIAEDDCNNLVNFFFNDNLFFEAIR
jgi:hypothetical protein